MFFPPSQPRANVKLEALAAHRDAHQAGYSMLAFTCQCCITVERGRGLVNRSLKEAFTFA